jgi:hypothetical protein
MVRLLPVEVGLLMWRLDLVLRLLVTCMRLQTLVLELVGEKGHEELSVDSDPHLH